MEGLMLDTLLSNNILSIITVVIFIVNTLLAVGLIFLERRSAQSVWAWLFVLFFLPILGFVIYMLFGRTIYNQKLFKLDEKDKVGLEYLVKDQLEELDDHRLDFPNKVTENHRKIVHMLLYNNQSFLTVNNSVQTFTNGREKFDHLIEDIQNAKDHIHVQYYIFRMDGIGLELYNALLQKQEEGVSVKILYDDMGSRGLSWRNFKAIKKAGGLVEAFFPSMLPLINPRINNRNHRKIVVIDGTVGYVGGFNVGDEYVGFDKKTGTWQEAKLPHRRDTHLRIEGDAVKSLQLRFMLDWNSHNKRGNLVRKDRYFPPVEYYGNIPMQVASSGPDEEWQQIKYGYLSMISSAKDSIYIQTPYFIPDQSVLEALRIAILSGVKVHLMIPDHPDHPFVYWATYSNAGALVDMGADVYIYESGFLHAKVMMIDDEMLSVGTTNIDVRSFLLNFEVNTFIYDEQEAIQQRLEFEHDIKYSSLLTKEIYDARSRWIKLKEAFSNLISPIL